MSGNEYARRAMAYAARIRELEREVERLKKENRLLREAEEYWRWKAWAERIGERRLDWE